MYVDRGAPSDFDDCIEILINCQNSWKSLTSSFWTRLEKKYEAEIYYIQVYVPQNICKIYFLHKISKTRFWWKLFVLLYAPSWQNFFLRCLKYIRQKDSLSFIVKFFNFFRYVPQNIHWHFQSYFQNDYTQSSEATFTFYFIKLSH